MKSRLLSEKKVALTSIAVVLALTTLMAQAPQRINYQGVARDNTGNVLQNQSISIRIEYLIWSSFEFISVHLCLSVVVCFSYRLILFMLSRTVKL